MKMKNQLILFVSLVLTVLFNFHNPNNLYAISHTDCDAICDLHCQLEIENSHSLLDGCTNKARPDIEQRCTVTIGARRPIQLSEIECSGQGSCIVRGVLKCVDQNGLPKFPTFTMNCNGNNPEVTARPEYVRCAMGSPTFGTVTAMCDENGGVSFLVY